MKKNLIRKTLDNRGKKYGTVRIILLSCLLLFVACFPCFADDDNSSSNQEQRTESTVTVEQLRISSNDTTGLHAIILDLIGDYNSIVKDYTYTTTSYNGSINTNHVVEITPDYSWIASCLLFIVMIYCVFRFLGSLVSGGKI